MSLIDQADMARQPTLRDNQGMTLRERSNVEEAEHFLRLDELKTRNFSYFTAGIASSSSKCYGAGRLGLTFDDLAEDASCQRSVRALPAQSEWQRQTIQHT